jgi:hypothetical protein
MNDEKGRIGRNEDNPELAGEWKRLSRLKEVTANMNLRNPPEEMWAGYWTSVYSRLERGLAWILVSIGAIVLGSWGSWQFVQDLMADADLPKFVKWSILALLVGLVMLLVSVLRHRVFVSRSGSGATPSGLATSARTSWPGSGTSWAARSASTRR